jgi:GAF domain-containing protein
VSTIFDASWMPLLIREASAKRLVEHRQQLLESTKADPEAVERELQIALELRSKLVSTRQQADELSVLNDLARRLASLHRPREVLQEVAAQARRLLSMDLTYILLLQDDGRLQIEVVEGSMGLGLRGLELSPGQGLAGRVLSTGQPMWSQQYLNDDMFLHVDNADAAVLAEHLGGVLGVPLMAGSETIGVLVAAGRRPRTFPDREVQLLAALATHAAVAIQSATLFERAAKAAERLGAANRHLEATIAQRQRSAQLRESLMAEILAGSGTDGVLARIEKFLGQPVYFLVEEDPGPRSRAIASLIGTTEMCALFTDTGVPLVSVDGPVGSALAAQVALPTGYVGCLVTADNDDVDDIRGILSIGVTSVALAVASERAVAEAELRTRGELAHVLLSAGSDERTARRRARATGLDIDAVTTLVAFDPGEADTSSSAVALANRAATRMANELGGWSSEYDGRVIVLISRIPTSEVVARAGTATGPRGRYTIGVASTEGGVLGLRRAHEMALQTARVLHGLGRAGECAQADDLGMFRSLFSQAGRNEVSEFVATTLGPLLEHDSFRRGDLTVTLSTYLQESQHHARTCARLHIHANTLYQRLERITALLEESWRQPDRTLELQMALRLRELARLTSD